MICNSTVLNHKLYVQYTIDSVPLLEMNANRSAVASAFYLTMHCQSPSAGMIESPSGMLALDSHYRFSDGFKS